MGCTVEEDEREFEDDFAVWPFRRQLVDRFARDDVTLVAAPPPRPRPRPWVEDTQPFPIVPLAPPSPPAGPLRVAVPFALVAFCAALAGSAALSGATGVEARLHQPIVEAAEAAAPQRVAAPAAKPAARHAAKAKRTHRKAAPRKAPPRREQLAARTPPAVAPAPPPVARVIVNSVVGLSHAVAADALRAEGLGVRVYGVPSSQPPGTVVAQHPRGGARADSGSYVRLNVAAR